MVHAMVAVAFPFAGEASGSGEAKVMVAGVTMGPVMEAISVAVAITAKITVRPNATGSPYGIEIVSVATAA